MNVNSDSAEGESLSSLGLRGLRDHNRGLLVITVSPLSARKFGIARLSIGVPGVCKYLNAHRTLLGPRVSKRGRVQNRRNSRVGEYARQVAGSVNIFALAIYSRACTSSTYR